MERKEWDQGKNSSAFEGGALEKKKDFYVLRRLFRVGKEGKKRRGRNAV